MCLELLFGPKYLQHGHTVGHSVVCPVYIHTHSVKLYQCFGMFKDVFICTSFKIPQEGPPK